MAIVTSQQIIKYYNQFKQIEVTFNKNITSAIGFLPRETYIKCGEDHWPCIVYSISMMGAKVIVNNKIKFSEKLKATNNLVNLRLSFEQKENSQPITFFVPSKVAGVTPYGQGNPSVSFLTLEYTHRPPDTLIETLGTLLEASIIAHKRKEQRIVINQNVLRYLKLKENNTLIYIQKVPRKCILRDISFSGSKVILMGVAKFLLNKKVEMKLEFEDPSEQFIIPGEIVRYEPVEGRKDIGAFAIHFEEKAIPLGYKMRLNEFLKSSVAKNIETAGPDAGEKQ